MEIKVHKFLLNTSMAIIIHKIENAWSTQMTGLTTNSEAFHQILAIVNTNFDWSISRLSDSGLMVPAGDPNILKRRLIDF